MPSSRFVHGDPALDDYNFGLLPDPAGVERIVASLPHGGELMAAAPHWMGDGMTGDHMPYLAYYEVEVPGWKAKDKEPPYIPQVGNNCTSRGMADGLDLLQFVEVADPSPDATEGLVFHRVCVEAVYAFGLALAGMRGDNGCYGAPIAKGVHDIGCITYDVAGGEKEETHSRLAEWARNPSAIVNQFKDKAGAFKVGSIARVTTWEEACAALANRRILTVASNVGYNGNRDEKGIVRRRGRWPHQMFYMGVIRSDGVESLVQGQSWGKNNPQGPQPFRLPSFAFRVTKEDAMAQISAGDTWAIGIPPNFEKAPLPSRWTNAGWAA
jgi:hypothetical protein